MIALSLAAWMSTAHAGTIYGIERTPTGDFNWFALDVDSTTRSVLSPFTGPVDPSRPGDLAWEPGAADLKYIPGGPFYREIYSVDPRTGTPSYFDNYTNEINQITYDTAGLYMWAFNLTGTPDFIWYYDAVGLQMHLPYVNVGTRAITMIGLGIAVAVDPATGDVFELDVSTGVEYLAGNLTIAPGNIRGLTYDGSANQILMIDGSGTLYEIDRNRAYEASEIVSGMGDVWALEVVPRSTTVSPTIVDYASCPGLDPVSIRDMTPGGNVAILLGVTGFSSVPSGGCAGTLLPIGRPSLVAMQRANAIGEINLTPTLPASVCGKKLMALDLTTCTITNATTL